MNSKIFDSKKEKWLERALERLRNPVVLRVKDIEISESFMEEEKAQKENRF